MPRSIWNGVITFGMVSIPVKLYTATEDKDLSFHQLHEKCQTRIKYQKFCPHCDTTVDSDEIRKGYEFARGQHVILTDEDFEQVPLTSKHAVEVSSFVKAEQIDPIYYDRTYYLEPDEAALRPFALFMKAITDKEMVAVATITIRNKERLCSLRPLGGTLLLDTLLYPDEIRVNDETEIPSVKISEKELQMAEHLIELMAEEFDPTQYKDHYREALKKVIEAKLEGKELEEVPEQPRAKVVDLMEALRASVEKMKAGGKGAVEKEKEEASPKRRKAAARSSEESAEAQPKRQTAASTKSDTKRTASSTRKRKKSA